MLHDLQRLDFAASTRDIKLAWASTLRDFAERLGFLALGVRWVLSDRPPVSTNVVVGDATRILEEDLERRPGRDLNRLSFQRGDYHFTYIAHSAGFGALYALVPLDKDPLPLLQQVFDQVYPYIPCATALLSSQARDQDIRTIFDTIRYPTVIIDTDRRVLSSNRSFQAMVGSSRSPYRLSENNALVFPETYDSVRFQKAVREFFEGKGTERIRIGDTMLEFRVLTLRRRAMLTLRHFNAVKLPSAEELRVTFHLTSRQSDLVFHLLKGETLAGYARRNKLSINTIRYHMDNVFATFECRSIQDVTRFIIVNMAL